MKTGSREEIREKNLAKTPTFLGSYFKNVFSTSLISKTDFLGVSGKVGGKPSRYIALVRSCEDATGDCDQRGLRRMSGTKTLLSRRKEVIVSKVIVELWLDDTLHYVVKNWDDRDGSKFGWTGRILGSWSQRTATDSAATFSNSRNCCSLIRYQLPKNRLVNTFDLMDHAFLVYILLAMYLLLTIMAKGAHQGGGGAKRARTPI